MGLFDGLRYGRPNYPLYLAEPYKPVEPTSLGLLAKLSVSKGSRKRANGITEKEVLPIGTLAQMQEYNTTEYLVKNKEKELYSRFMKLQETNPDDWQSNEEGKSIQNEMLNLSKVDLVQKTNIKRLPVNKTSILEAQKDLMNPNMMAANQYAYENGEFIRDEQGKLIKKIDANIMIDENIGYDKEGYAITIKPYKAVKGDAWKKPMDDMYEGIKSALNTYETGKNIIGSLKGKIILESGTSSNNIYALEANTVQSYLESLNPDETESLKQTYMNLKENDSYALTIPERNQTSGKVIKDDNGNVVTKEMDYTTWVADLLAHKDKRNKVTSYTRETSLVDIPGAEAEANAKYNWYRMAAKGTPELDWTYYKVSMGKEIENVFKNTNISAIKNIAPNNVKPYIDMLQKYMKDNPKTTVIEAIEGISNTLKGNAKIVFDNGVSNIMKNDKLNKINNVITTSDYLMSLGNIISGEYNSFLVKKIPSINGIDFSLFVPSYKLTGDALSSAKITSMDEYKYSHSEYYNKPINNADKLYGLGGTEFSLENSIIDGKSIHIIGTDNVMFIAGKGEYNPQIGTNNDLAIISGYVMIPENNKEAWLSQMKIKYNGKEYSYNDDEVKNIVKNTIITTTVQDALRIKSEGLQVPKKMYGYKKTDEVILVPLAFDSTPLWNSQYSSQQQLGTGEIINPMTPDVSAVKSY